MTLDLLGPGSIIGQNFVLKGEKWPYQAINNQQTPCEIMKITYAQIMQLMQHSAKVKKQIQEFEENIDINGLT